MQTDRQTGTYKMAESTGRTSAWCTEIRLPNAIIILKSALQSLKVLSSEMDQAESRLIR
jgi:hypothetical protein